MNLLIFMLPMMLTVGGAFLALFLWAIANSQYDDLEGEKHRIFFEDGKPGAGRP